MSEIKNIISKQEKSRITDLEYQKRYRKANKEKISAYFHLWRLKNPKKYKDICKRAEYKYNTKKYLEAEKLLNDDEYFLEFVRSFRGV